MGFSVNDATRKNKQTKEEEEEEDVYYASTSKYVQDMQYSSIEIRN